MDNYREPTDEEIRIECQLQGLNYSSNYWHVREQLRIRFNGPPPNGTSSWGIYWKAY